MTISDDWQFHQLFGMVKLVDGNECREPLVMRRERPDGGWQYRLPTEAETRDYLSRDGW